MLTSRTETVSIDAPPSAVHAYVADPMNLPAWAPDFASGVGVDGGVCQITQGEATFPIRVLASAESGTLDLVAPDDPTRGAFTRVIPNGAGSEYSFTLLFPADTDPAAVDRQMEVVVAELGRVRDACEASIPAA